MCPAIAGPVKTIYGTVEAADGGNVDGAMVIVSAAGFVNETTTVSNGAWQVDIGPDTGSEWPNGTFFSVRIIYHNVSFETMGVVNGTYTNVGSCILNASSFSAKITVDSTSASVDESIDFSVIVTGGESPFTYFWDFNNDGDFDDATERNTSYRFHSTGSKTINLRVTDGNGDVSMDTITITITEKNAPSGGDDDPADPINNDPIAQVQVSSIYEVVNKSILFNGSASFDKDDDLLNFTWDFDDGTQRFQPVVHHSFQKAGSYFVTLTVSDGKGGIDNVTTEIIIQQSLNYHPEKPILIGPRKSSTNQSILFTITSFDKDNDSIRYIIDWDDNTTTITDFMPNTISTPLTHQWNASGIYTITVSAEDTNNASSPNTTTLIFIDVDVIFINDSINGYLIDTDQDGVFDLYHHNATQNEHNVKKQDNHYLIDTNNDETWDYLYNITNGLQSYIDDPEKNSQNTPDLSIMILIVFIVVHLIFKKK